MKVIILSTFEQSGGAAIAANRLVKALRKSDIDAKMLVRDKQSNNPNVTTINSSFVIRWLNKARFIWERFIIWIHNHFSRKNLFAVSIANTGYDLSKHPLIKEADIIHLHWINQGFLSIKNINELIQTGKPIVWTMHDMWPCTGICHHAYCCDKFMNECGSCYFLGSNKKNDLSHEIWKKKQFLNKSNINIVTVSSWLESMMHISSLMNKLNKITIPNVIDTDVFRPHDKDESRQILSLPKDRKILLMGAVCLDDKIKGAIYLKEALKYLSKTINNILLVFWGNIKDKDVFFSDVSVSYIYMGAIDDINKIVRLYTAADVTVTPSLYETFGQTISESMACGCPVVSFNNSGQIDIIDHKMNGYLAKYMDSKDLADGIDWVLNEADYEKLSVNARKKIIENYSENIVAKQYIKLYKSILN